MELGQIEASSPVRVRLPAPLDYGYLIGSAGLVAFAAASAWELIDFPLGFWLLFFITAGSLVARILRVREARTARWGFLGILVLLTSMRISIFLAVPRLYGFDPFAEIRIATVILSEGWDLTSLRYEFYGVTYISPILYLFAGSGILIADLPSEWIAKWIPSLYSVGSVLFLYLLGHLLTNSRRAALLTALVFANFHMYVLFHGLFIRESLAFVFFLGTIYAYIRAHRQRDIRMAFVSLTFALVTVLTHHMTAFLLGLFFAVAGVHQIIQARLIGRKASGRSDPRSPHLALGVLSFGVLVIVSTLGYWSFLRFTPIQILAEAFRDASRFQPAFFHAPNTLRTYILLYGEVVFAALFGTLALAGVFLGPYRKARWPRSFLVWGALMGVVSIALLERLITWQNLATTFMASRFETFGYPFLFILGFGYLISVGRKRRHIRKVSFAVILAFLVFGAYHVPPNLFLGEEPNWAAGEERFYITEAEFAAIQMPFDLSRSIAGDAFYVNFFSPVMDKFEDTEALERTALQEGATFDYLLLRNLWLQSSVEEVRASYGRAGQVHSLVYDNGEVVVYTG